MIAAAPIAGGWFALAPASSVVVPPVVVPPVVSVVTVDREVPAFTNPSVVRIANMALQRVGATQPITSLEEPSKEARIIRQVWDHLRDNTLQEFAWGFATSHQALPLVDVVRSPWLYCYRLPADCLHPLAIVLPQHAQTSRERIPFTVQSEGGGPIVCTDAEDAVLSYLARLVDPLDWPSWFHELLTWRLAHEIAMPMTVDPRLAQFVAQQLAQARVMAAQRSASTGLSATMNPPSAFVTARGDSSLEIDLPFGGRLR